MVDLHLVVQSERVVTQAPVVTNPVFFVDDQCIHTQVAEPRSYRKSGVAAADHNYGGIAVRISPGLVQLVLPVGASKVARVRFPGRALPAGPFFESSEFLQSCQQRPGFVLPVFGLIGAEPDNAASPSHVCTEREERLDGLSANAHNVSRRQWRNLNL